MPYEIPYSRMNPSELRDLEAEFGKPLTPELAQWLLRARMNRQAVQLMIGDLTLAANTSGERIGAAFASAAARR